MQAVGVIGGGLAGLVVALRLRSAGVRIVVYETAERLGGQILTEHSAGYVIEHGAEGFVSGSEAVLKLCRQLGLAERVIGQSTNTSLGFDGTDLRPLAPGEAARFLGFQVAERALGAGIQTLLGGMSELTDQLAAALTSEVRVVRPLGSLQVVRAAEGWRVTAGQEVHAFEKLVFACGAETTARLVQSAVPQAATLADASVLSSVTVSLAWPALPRITELNATGFVVAEAAQRHGMRACSFVSSKFIGRAPEGKVLLRAFFRPTPDEVTALSDTEWQARAQECLRPVLPELTTPPEHAWTSRWKLTLPVFDAEHRERVRRAEEALNEVGALLAGAAFHSPGIDGAVRSANEVARRLMGTS